MASTSGHIGTDSEAVGQLSFAIWGRTPLAFTVLSFGNQQAKNPKPKIRHRPNLIFNSSSSVNRHKTKLDKLILLQQRYSDWISNMDVVLTDQSGQLSTTLTAWDEFEKRCCRYFPKDTHFQLETSIGHTFSKIKVLKVRLDGLSNEISRDQSTVCINIQDTTTRSSRLTHSR